MALFYFNWLLELAITAGLLLRYLSFILLVMMNIEGIIVCQYYEKGIYGSSEKSTIKLSGQDLAITGRFSTITGRFSTITGRFFLFSGFYKFDILAKNSVLRLRDISILLPSVIIA